MVALGKHDRGVGGHDRGKPCHYYIRNGYPVTLGCIFHELRNIITALLLSAAICLSRNIVKTGLAPVLFSPPSRLTRQPCFLAHRHLS